jgi:hypothetical protein
LIESTATATENSTNRNSKRLPLEWVDVVVEAVKPVDGLAVAAAKVAKAAGNAQSVHQAKVTETNSFR